MGPVLSIARTLLPDAAAFPECQVILDDPVIEEHEDVLYVPRSGPSWDDDASWGLYDRNGERIHAAAYCRGARRVPVGGSGRAAVDAADIVDAPERHYVYAGPLHLHYGHFLVATLSRLWAFRNAGHLQFLWHSAADPVAAAGFPHVPELLGAAGLALAQFRHFTRPTRIRHVTVAAPAFEEDHFAHHAYQRLCRAAGERLAPDSVDGGRPQPPAYLSRTGMSWGLRSISNEAEVCQALAGLGVEIVQPETLTVAEQVRLFAADRVIMGLGGSGFHTAALAPPCARLVAIDLTRPTNQVLINRVNGVRMLHLVPADAVETVSGTGAILTFYRFPDPAGVARDLLHAAQGFR